MQVARTWGKHEARRSSADMGLSLLGIPFVANAISGSGMTRLLTDKQRHELESLSTRVDVPPRRVVYREGTESTSIFICRKGAFKAFRDLPSGTRRVASFLFPGDVFGLAENGRYVNTVQAITDGRYNRIPLDSLTAVLRHDAELQLVFLTKVTHALRESQRRAIILGRRSATGRLAMFLKMLQRSVVAPSPVDVIAVPMSRTDIANYVGLSAEAISRATAQLTREGIIKFQGLHAVRILDRHRFRFLAADI